jgi:DNA-binding CsgD family transcriptional regulator
VGDWHLDLGAEILRAEMAVAPTAPATLIGRSEDLAALDAALEQARGGDPVTVLVAGEAGIGKTRVIQEFSERAFAQGARVLTGSCVDLGDSALPYGAVVDALRSAPFDAYDELGPALRHALAALIPEAAPDDEPYEGTQAGLFGAVLRLLEQLGRHEPLVLVLEDVHWADPSTRDMLKFLVSGLRQTAVLLVLTHRTDEVAREHPVQKLLAELQRSPRVRSIVLAPLTRAETSKQLAALSGGPVDRRLVDAIYARSEGNPLFSEELLARGADAGAVPSSLRDALLARLDALPPDAQAVARVAAAVGRQVDHDLLAAIADTPDDELDAALRACMRGHVLVVDDAHRGYRFRHGLLQEVAAAELLPGERVRLHRRVADVLEAQPEVPGSAGARRLAEIAHHRLLSEDPPAALAAALDAARAAEQVHAPREASRNYDAVLELWDAIEPSRRPADTELPSILERAARCRWHGMGDPHGSVPLLERALDELGDDAPALRRADILSQLGMAKWRAFASIDDDLEMQYQALALLDDSPSEVAARVHAFIASSLMIRGDFAESEREAARAVEIARAVGARREEADALITQFVCRGVAGDEAATRALIDEARGPTLEAFDGDVVRRFFTNSAFVLHGFAGYEEALAVALEGIEAETRAGTNPHGQLCVYENAADLMCLLGRPSEAAELIGDEDGAFTSDMIVMHFTVARIALMKGELDAAAARLARTRAEGGDLEAMLLLPTCAFQADTALWREDYETALEACRTGELALIEGDQIACSELLVVAVRAQAEAVAAGALDPAAGTAEADRLLARLEQIATTGVRLPAPDAALLTAIAERSRLAAEPDAGAWRTARDAWSAIGRPYDTTYADLRLAQALAATHGPRDELERVLCDAHERSIRIEASHFAAAVEALARRTRVALPGVEGTDGTAFPDLTKREREVLALVADGRTNRQIAQELFIADKTASVHVSNILGKLGASNRGEAAAIAHKAGFELTEAT